MSNWTEILEEITSKVNYKNNRGAWYRGQSNSEWKLNSSLYRITKNQKMTFINEKNIYNYFSNFGSEYSDFNENKGWNTLFLMQHYGLETRLLDWTGSFAVALYFANLGRIDEMGQPKEGCIWILDPFKLNKQGYDKNTFFTVDNLPGDIRNYEDIFNNKIEGIRSLAMVPRRSNNRIKIQDGYFTIQGTMNTDLESELEEIHALERIILPPDTYEESMNYLKLNGINYYTLFGGIEGLCTHIKKEILRFKYENI